MTDSRNALDMLDEEIARDEETLTALVDRVDAMWELREVAASVEQSRPRPVTFDDLLAACETPRDRAKMLSLFERVARSTGPSGPDEEETGRHHLDSAEGLSGVGRKVLS
jgi:hypothetical protein